MTTFGTRRRRIAALALAIAAAAAGTAILLPGGDGEDGERRGPEYGIGTQSFYDFGNPQLHRLGLRRARLILSYDVVAAGERGFRRGDPNQPGELEATDRWMAAARRHGYEPLVSFGFSRTRPRSLPSVRAYLRHVRAFLDRYFPGWNRAGGRGARVVFTPWNEPNNPDQPTFGRPERAAAYFVALRRLCGRRCRVVAGDFAQTGRRSQDAYVRLYREAITGPPPRAWAYHPYGDVNGVDGGLRGVRGTLAMVREALGTAPGELWLTEVGGILEDARGAFEPRDEGVAASPTHGRASGPTAEEREQVAEVRHLVERVAQADPRITRVYYYLFRAKGFPLASGERRGCRNFSTFDSGLVRECSRETSDRITPAGTAVSDRSTLPRPAYRVFKRAAVAGR